VNGAAVVGCGLVGSKRARALRELGVPVVAVHDVDTAAADALASELEGAVVASSPHDAFGRDGVDFAIVATDHGALSELAVNAIECGRDVLVEKPGGRTVAELADVAAAAQRAGRRVRVGYNHRFHPAVRAVHAATRSGEYGSLMWLRARYGHGGRLGYEHEWRADPKRSGGGELLDQGSHLVDLARFLAGDVDLAFSELRTDFWPMPVEDNAFLGLRAAGGGFVWLHASWTEWKNEFEMEIALRTARLDVRGLGGSYGPERLVVHAMRPEMGVPDTSERSWPGSDDSWRDEVADVRAELHGHPAIGAGITDAIAVMRIVEEAYAR